MLTFDFRNCTAQAVGVEHGLTESDFTQVARRSADALQKLKKWRELDFAAFLSVPDHVSPGLLEKALQVRKTFENFVVFGIGGSALGLKALANALLPPHHNLLDAAKRNGSPRLFICDNIDPDTVAALFETLDLQTTCFNVISKSGSTVETMAQLFLLLEQLQKELGASWKNHVIVTTDSKKGELRSFAEREGLASFSVPHKVGGRYSVLTPVGLFGAACLRVDVEGLIAGALEARARSATDELKMNPALMIAALHFFLQQEKGKSIAVLFPYGDALSLFADWYVQLWAESLGKEGKGTTPLKAVGATDQHSQLQLFMEGPNDKVFAFLGVKQFRADAEKMRLRSAWEPFAYLEGYALGDLLRAEQRATSGALRRAGRPNYTITLPQLDARTMGELLMTYQIATALSGALYEINPFDQPGVELSKVLTRELLSRRRPEEIDEMSISLARSESA